MSDLSSITAPPALNSTTNPVRSRLQGLLTPIETKEDLVNQSEPVVSEEITSSDDQEPQPSTSTGVKRKLESAIPKAPKRVRAVAKKVRSNNNIN